MKGERTVLKRLRVTDVTQRYVDWLNDPRANCFLSRGGVHHQRSDVEKYVRSYEDASEKLLLALSNQVLVWM